MGKPKQIELKFAWTCHPELVFRIFLDFSGIPMSFPSQYSNIPSFHAFQSLSFVDPVGEIGVEAKTFKEAAILQEFAHRQVFDLPASLKEHRPRAEIHRQKEIVGDDQFGLLNGSDSIRQDATSDRIEVIRRFVEGQNLRVHR